MYDLNLIKTRKSFRTFDGRPITAEDRKKLEDYIATIRNPYDIPVTFLFLDAEECGLSSPVIAGEHLYIAGKVPQVEHCEEAFGYSFEDMILYAWSLGIGTTWIGGTMDRKLFENAAETGADEYMPCVTPLGYPCADADRTEVDIKLRNMVHGDERFAAEEIFFENDFATPLRDKAHTDALEAVRWYPSASNRQPCRIVKAGDAYHFYKVHPEGYQRDVAWNVQKIDLGIALCHFMSVAGGRLEIRDPGIETAADTEYIATVVL